MIHHILANYSPIAQKFYNNIRNMQTSIEVIESPKIYVNIKIGIRIIEDQFQRSLISDLKRS